MKFVTSILLCCLLVSCGQGVSRVLAAPAPSYVVKGSDLNAVERKLIKNGSITLKCVDVKQAASEAEEIVKKHGGFVENKTEGDDVTLDTRIPVQQLTVGMDELAELGKVTHRRVRVRDVTDEYIDVDAKIRNLRALRERLKKLYAKAGKVEDVLKIEKELTRVQSDLDSLEGRMKAMKKNIAYSELSISINRKRIPGPAGAVSKGFGWVFKKLWILN